MESLSLIYLLNRTFDYLGVVGIPFDNHGGIYFAHAQPSKFSRHVSNSNEATPKLPCTVLRSSALQFHVCASSTTHLAWHNRLNREEIGWYTHNELLVRWLVTPSYPVAIIDREQQPLLHDLLNVELLIFFFIEVSTWWLDLGCKSSRICSPWLHLW